MCAEQIVPDSQSQDNPTSNKTQQYHRVNVLYHKEHVNAALLKGWVLIDAAVVQYKGDGEAYHQTVFIVGDPKHE